MQDRRGHRQRVEGGLDDAESLRAASALIRISNHPDAEVELGKRRGADRVLEIARRRGADQHRGVEQRAHHANGSVSPGGNRSRSSWSACGAGVASFHPFGQLLVQRVRAAATRASVRVTMAVSANCSV